MSRPAAVLVALATLVACGVNHQDVVDAARGAAPAAPGAVDTGVPSASGGADLASTAPVATGASSTNNAGSVSVAQPVQRRVVGTQPKTSGQKKTPGVKPAPAAGGANGGTSAGGASGFGSILHGNCRPAALSPVSIGNIGTYSGVLGAIFVSAPAGVRIWASAANACGGLNGHPIKVITADDTGDPATALTLTKQMVENSHVIAFVNDIVPLSLGSIPAYLKEKGVPQIGGCDCQPGEFNSEMWFPDIADQGYTAGYTNVKVAVERGYRKLASFSCAEAPVQCQAYMKGATEAAAKFGASMVASGYVSLAAPSFVAQCQQAKSNGAQAVLLGLDSGSYQRFASNCANSLNYRPALLALAFAVIAKNLEGDSNLNGFTVTNPTFPWIDGSVPVTAAFQKAIKTYSPDLNSGGPAALSWAGGVITQEASKFLSEQNPTSAELLKGLYTVKSNTFGGMVPPLTYTPELPRVVPMCYWISEIRDGKWTTPFGNKSFC
jgi:branched-chain amino acid transport system substrate-binding protein